MYSHMHTCIHTPLTTTYAHNDACKESKREQAHCAVNLTFASAFALSPHTHARRKTERERET